MKRVFVFLQFLIIVFYSLSAIGADKPLPYLGPGTDKLSPEEYRKVYTQYIRESVLLGYPLAYCADQPCQRSLEALFRLSGLYTYPVPGGADIKQWKGKFECYQSGGVLAQLERDSTGALVRLILVHSKTPAALKKITQVCSKQEIRLEKDATTALEKVASVPVGYPHPYLCPESQGLFVRTLEFNHSRNTCKPISYQDNSWVGGYVLNNLHCTSIQNNFQQTIDGTLAPGDFASRARKLHEDAAIQNAIKNGASPEEAKKLVEKYMQGMFQNDVAIVGSAMRDLEFCNLLGMGDEKQASKAGKESPKTPNSGSVR